MFLLQFYSNLLSQLVQDLLPSIPFSDLFEQEWSTDSIGPTWFCSQAIYFSALFILAFLWSALWNSFPSLCSLPALHSEVSQMILSFPNLNWVFYYFLQDSCSTHRGTLSTTLLSFAIPSDGHPFPSPFFHPLSLPFPSNSIWSTWADSSSWAHWGESFPLRPASMTTPLYQQRWPSHFFLGAEFCSFFSRRKEAPFENGYLRWSGAVSCQLKIYVCWGRIWGRAYWRNSYFWGNIGTRAWRVKNFWVIWWVKVQDCSFPCYFKDASSVSTWAPWDS